MNTFTELRKLSDTRYTDLIDEAPLETEVRRLAEFFRVLGDPTRVRILSFLAREELCVHDLAALTEMEQSAVSHQLRTLRTHRIVKVRRSGKHALYSLDDNHIDQLTRIGLEHIREIR